MVTLCCEDRFFQDIQAIIFDKDGTLADSEVYLKSLGQKRARLVDAKIPGVQEPLLQAFGLADTGVNPMGLLAVGSRRDNEIAAAAYIAETGRDWAAALEIAAIAFQEAESYLRPKVIHTPLLPHLAEWITQFSQVGLKLGILSADTPEQVAAFIDTYQLSPSISAHRGVEDDGLSKPDPRLYRAICHQLDVSPEQTLMVGDSTLDMIMARNAGSAGAIGVTWGWSKPPAITHSDCIIHQPSALKIL